jgi:hypothetical protein
LGLPELPVYYQPLEEKEDHDNACDHPLRQTLPPSRFLPARNSLLHSTPRQNDRSERQRSADMARKSLVAIFCPPLLASMAFRASDFSFSLGTGGVGILLTVLTAAVSLPSLHFCNALSCLFDSSCILANSAFASFACHVSRSK